MATGDDQKVHSKETQQISGDLKKKRLGFCPMSSVFCWAMFIDLDYPGKTSVG